MNHSIKTLIVAQLIISFFMALSMIAISTFITMGLNMEAVQEWLTRFVMAWPVAFILANIVSRFAFPLAIRLTVRRESPSNKKSLN